MYVRRHMLELVYQEPMVYRRLVLQTILLLRLYLQLPVFFLI